MTDLSAEIAVLDGLDDLYGSTMEMIPGGSYTKQVMPFVQSRNNVIDASEGGNYSGGSSYAPGLPLLPSTVGLADLELDSYLQSTNTGVLPPRRNVIDPSMGANYTGGSSYAPGVPLTVSSSGLADLDDLSAAAQMLDPNDGRIGQQPAYGTEYSKWLMPGVYTRQNVIDASEGANYSGGSSYAPGLPLLPSTIGLAGLDGHDEDPLDGVSDEEMGLEGMFSRLKKAVGISRLRRLKSAVRRVGKKISRSTNPFDANRLRQVAMRMGAKVARVRQVRRKLIKRARNLMNNAPFARTFATRVAGRGAGALTKYAKGMDVAQRMLSRRQRRVPMFTGNSPWR